MFKFLKKSHTQEKKSFQKKYDKIYTPIYNEYCLLNGEEPEIYNKQGNKIHVFFIRDRTSCHLSSQRGNYILWDKYNFELKTQFYTHECILDLMGHPDRRYCSFIETKGINPNSYTLLYKNPILALNFNKIFTYDEVLLNKFSNTRFVPFCAEIKLDFEYLYKKSNNSINFLDDSLYKKKNKLVSMLSSDKEFCELHKLRINTIRILKRLNLVDAYGTFDCGTYVKSVDTLKDYYFSICFENVISEYTFTEKITNCFAMQVIPIYLGATKISDFFNSDGRIQLNINDVLDVNRLSYILKKCTKEFYLERKEAILDNYNRVKQYLNIEDFMYEKYLQSEFN